MGRRGAVDVSLIAEWLLSMIEDRLLSWRPETTVNE
jgi:NitT/TauT family transport system permease protein